MTTKKQSGNIEISTDIHCGKCKRVFDRNDYAKLQSDVEDNEDILNALDDCDPFSLCDEPAVLETRTTWECPNCYEENDMLIKVVGENAIWEHSELKEMAIFNGYQYARLLKLKRYPELLETFDAVSSEIVHESKSKPLVLCIIAKTKMYGGFCYIGYDQEHDCLVRPIYRTKQKSCCWGNDVEMEVGRWYSFQAYERQIKHCTTDYPHKMDDVLVNGKFIKGALHGDDLTKALLRHCESTIDEAYWGKLVQENGKFHVLENAVCPSVGLLHVSKSSIRFELDKKNKIRLHLHECSFSVTIADTSVIEECKSWEKIILVTGLARAWAGYNNMFSTKRCYVMIIGILPGDVTGQLEGGEAKKDESEDEESFYDW